MESVLNDPEFSYSNLKTLFAESEKRTFQTSNHLEESKGRLGGKYDAFFRDHFQKNGLPDTSRREGLERFDICRASPK